VTPYSPGGAGDWVARTATDRISQALGQPFVIEPRPGAGGNIAAESVVRASADGTRCSSPRRCSPSTPRCTASSHSTRPRTWSRSASSPPGLRAVRERQPAGEKRGRAGGDGEAEAGAINYASLGIGTGPHLGGVLLGLMGGAEFTHVPYKGFGQALPDLASGQVHFSLNGIGVADAFLKDGRVKMLGFTSLARMKEYPDVPTVAETVPGYEVLGWYGFAAPAATPRPVIERLNAELARSHLARVRRAAREARLIPQSFSLARRASSSRAMPSAGGARSRLRALRSKTRRNT
jgi:tripartite-type tricarboxylate transporter receptor subunit TctC